MMVRLGYLVCNFANLVCDFADAAKLKFVRDAMGTDFKFENKVEIGKDLQHAIDWVAERSAQKVTTSRYRHFVLHCFDLISGLC